MLCRQCSRIPDTANRNYIKLVSLWRRANARNVRLYYPYWQYTILFIFRFVYLYFVYAYAAHVPRLYKVWCDCRARLMFWDVGPPVNVKRDEGPVARNVTPCFPYYRRKQYISFIRFRIRPVQCKWGLAYVIACLKFVLIVFCDVGTMRSMLPTFLY